MFELVAAESPDKGDVVRTLIADLDVGVAFGDDIGDIAAFQALDTAAAHAGLSVLKIAVGGNEAPPGLTDRADFTVGSPHEVSEVLTALADALDRAGEAA